MENCSSCQTGNPVSDGSRYCGGTGEYQDHEASPGIGRSIRPGVPCPETVLVAVMSDGSYLLVGYPQSEPAAFVVGEDTYLLRQAIPHGRCCQRARQQQRDNGTQVYRRVAEPMTDMAERIRGRALRTPWS